MAHNLVHSSKRKRPWTCATVGSARTHTLPLRGDSAANVAHWNLRKVHAYKVSSCCCSCCCRCFAVGRMYAWPMVMSRLAFDVWNSRPYFLNGGRRSGEGFWLFIKSTILSNRTLLLSVSRWRWWLTHASCHNQLICSWKSTIVNRHANHRPLNTDIEPAVVRGGTKNGVSKREGHRNPKFKWCVCFVQSVWGPYYFTDRPDGTHICVSVLPRHESYDNSRICLLVVLVVPKYLFCPIRVLFLFFLWPIVTLYLSLSLSFSLLPFSLSLSLTLHDYTQLHKPFRKVMAED